jgi:hypothetical protein
MLTEVAAVSTIVAVSTIAFVLIATMFSEPNEKRYANHLHKYEVPTLSQIGTYNPPRVSTNYQQVAFAALASAVTGALSILGLTALTTNTTIFDTGTAAVLLSTTICSIILCAKKILKR